LAEGAFPLHQRPIQLPIYGEEFALELRVSVEPGSEIAYFMYPSSRPSLSIHSFRQQLLFTVSLLDMQLFRTASAAVAIRLGLFLLLPVDSLERA